MYENVNQKLHTHKISISGTCGGGLSENRNMDTRQEAHVLKYEGCNFFRQRLILATVSGRSVKVSKIRSKDEEPGLKGMNLLTKRRTSDDTHRVREWTTTIEPSVSVFALIILSL